MTTTPDTIDPDFIGDPNGGDGGIRSNGIVGGADFYDGEPCSSCAEPLLWDRDERMIYCVNDWYHG